MSKQRTQPGPDFRFEGFENPTTTPVPDVVFDLFLSHLKEAELKVLLYIIRRTFGFKKDRDPISFNQFLRGITVKKDGRVLDRGCGIKSRTTLSSALKSLEAMGIVQAEKGMDERGENVTTVYRLHFKSGHEDGVVRNPYHPSTDRVPPVVSNSYPQETGLQETVKQQTDTSFEHSNIRTVQPGKERGHTLEGERSPREKSGSRGYATPGDVLAQRASSPYFPGVIALEGRGEEPVKRKPGRPASKPRPETETEEWQVIQQYVSDFMRLLGDLAPLKSSTTRAYNLFVDSGLPLATFLNKLHEARSRTQESSGNIEQEGRDAHGIKRKTKAAYFFAVLEDVLNLISDAERARREAGTGVKTRGRPKKNVGDTQPNSPRERDSDGPYGGFIEH